MRAITTILVLQICFFSYGQQETPTLYNYSYRDKFQVIDSFFKLEKEYDFRLEMQSVSFRKSGQEFFVLSSKNNKWSARLFIQILKDSGTAWKEYPCISSPKALYDSLMAYNFLGLRSQEDIQDTIVAKSDFGVLDGATYHFNIVSQDRSSVITYHCPKTWSKEFPNVQEFSRVISLLRLIYLSFGFTNAIKC